MRVLLVGPPAERAALRAELTARAIVVAAEFGTLAEARAAGIAADAFVSAVRPDTRAVDEPLTRREIDVVALLAEGLSNKAIATRLGISDQTVKFHVASIAGKLGAANRTDAVRIAVRRGIVEI
jgi:DNA-binding NarL/FixJ family response regulator